MKNILLSFVFLVLANFAQATIRRVGYTGTPINNIDFAYSNLQGAANAANPGDTIQVYQQLAVSTTSLGISKPLVILGFGHTLNINTGNQIQNAKDSSNNYIYAYFYPGSAGSVIQGLNLYSCVVYDSNITVTRCRFRYQYTQSSWNACGTSSTYLYPTNGGSVQINTGYGYNLKNIKINGCYFDGNLSYSNSISFSGPYAVTNLTITNNYFNSPVNLYNGTNGQVNGVFANNIMNFKFQHLSNINSWNGNVCSQGLFYYNYQSYNMVSNFDFFLIKNNIFNTDDTVTCPLNAPNCIIQNNVFTCAASYACSSAGGGNNIFGANMSTVFGPAWNDGFVYNDNQLALGASSAAINAGVKGDNSATNCGVYGGEAGQAYKQSGIPPVPSFYLMSTPGINATSNPYNITISVKSNN